MEYILCSCGSGKPYQKCCVFLDEIRKKYSYIKPGEKDDSEWYNQGLEYMDENKIDKAENMFKKLIMSQPEHHDGFLGLANVYKKKGEREKMIYFYDQAIKRAKEFLKNDSIDPEAIEMIEDEKDEAIKN
ncbi:MAG: hypothetical protein CVT88_01185 [Candidatus Altiarchaeales archaeon HGW-Altiarchaeales-1]|nr:MAG: hypothetical protein CVT88_01185 [Candidatus Altiarchaeales archaeon HGW-Altiarchaeales-1]